MELYCLRHGLAADRVAGGLLTDAERPLTAEGRRKVRAVARGMRAMDLSFDRVFSSPCVRAWETARIVGRSLGALERLKAVDWLSPGARPREIVEKLCQLDPPPQRLLLVGHEPDLSQLVSLLAGGTMGFAVVLKKAGLCKLTAESLASPGCAALEWLLTPKQLMAQG